MEYLKKDLGDVPNIKLQDKIRVIEYDFMQNETISKL